MKRSRRAFLALVALASLMSPLVASAEETAAGGVLESRTLAFEGAEQPYLLYLPAGHDPQVPAPLVLLLSGSNVRPEAMLRVGFNEEADRWGAIVVYPGLETPTSPIWVRFISQLLDAVQAEFNVDSARVYASGFSRGAAVTHVLACQLSDRISAFAPVDAAPAPTGPHSIDFRGRLFDCYPNRAVPLVLFHGTESGQSPYANAQAIIAHWAQFNGCREDPEVTIHEAHGQQAIQETHSECREGAQVTLYSLQGAPHAWPGAPLREGELRMGTNEEEPASMAIAATPIIAAFFQAHPMPR